MTKNYANQNLRRASFRNEDLRYAGFSGSDLRGVDFTGADLTGADFTRVKTGIPPLNKILLFLAALAVSLCSGYVAMLAGHTMQEMLHSGQKPLTIAGWISAAVVILFIIYSIWKGVGNAVRHLTIPVVSVVVLLGTVALITGTGKGVGTFYIILSFLLVVLMFIIGTVARAAAGSLSDVLFTVVALAGGVFGKSVGGGAGTVVMALSCMVISKRALSGAKGFETLRKIAAFVTSRFGTSFRGTRLSSAQFSGSKIHNADFTNADTAGVQWGDSEKINCVTTENNFAKLVKESSVKISGHA